MSYVGVHLRALWSEGWRALVRAPSLWGLVGGAVILGAAAVWTEVPLREEGRFTLGAVALIDQLLVLLLVGVAILVVKPAAPAPWWPCSGESALVGRGLGMTAAVLAATLLTLLIQYGFAAIRGDLLVDVPLEPPQRIDGAYLDLAGALALYGLVLMSWGQVLRLAVGPGLGLLMLLLLVFSGYVLPRLAADAPPMELVTWMLPDLGAIAPVRLIEGDRSVRWTSWAGYAVLHAAMVWALGAVILRIQWDRGRSVELDASGP